MLLILRSTQKLLRKTREFNKKITHHLKNAGVDFSFSSFEAIELFMETDKIGLFIEGKPLSTWKTIYPRKVGPHKLLAFILATLCKENKQTFIDRFHENYSPMAKVIQVFLFAKNGIPIPKTYYSPVYSPKQIKSAINFLNLPVVVKQCNTSQGTGVFLAKTPTQLKKAIEALLANKNKGSVFLQEFIPNTFEYRVFVTGKRVGAVEKKIRTKEGEFRNNVFLGAREEFLKTSTVKKNILDLALKASRVSNTQVSGVDIVDSNGRLVVFEVNSCPGLTMEEKISPELSSLANYLKECEKK